MHDSILSPLERFAHRELVRFAASHNISCPECSSILDQKTTVVVTDTADNTIARCAACYGHGPRTFTCGTVTVLDGRTLFGKRDRKGNWK